MSRNPFVALSLLLSRAFFFYISFSPVPGCVCVYYVYMCALVAHVPSPIFFYFAVGHVYSSILPLSCGLLPPYLAVRSPTPPPYLRSHTLLLLFAYKDPCDVLFVGYFLYIYDSRHRIVLVEIYGQVAIIIGPLEILMTSSNRDLFY